jgi:DNA-binding SARP family transcriptional activator
MLQAKLLGHFEIHLDDQPIILPSRTAQSFFAFLLLHPYTSHRREMLAGQFWPNSSETNARNNLRHALWCIVQHWVLAQIHASKVMTWE